MLQKKLYKYIQLYKRQFNKLIYKKRLKLSLNGKTQKQNKIVTLVH